MLEKMIEARRPAMIVGLFLVSLGVGTANAQSAAEKQRADFLRNWELGEQIRTENERSGSVIDWNRPENHVKVDPQGPTRDTPARNSWEGLYDRYPNEKADRSDYSNPGTRTTRATPRETRGSPRAPSAGRGNPRAYGGGTAAYREDWNFAKYAFSRAENPQVLSFANGDAFALPLRGLWPGDANVSVALKEYAGRRQYLVTIDSKAPSKPLEQRIREIVEKNGLGFAVSQGLAYVVGRNPYGAAVVNTIKPSPLNGEIVMRTWSAHYGMVEVHILNAR